MGLSSVGFLQNLRELNQVRHAKKRPPCRHNDERFISIGAGPSRRDRSQFIFLVQIEYPVLSPALAVMRQLKFTPKQGMKRMGYTETSLLNIRIGCI
jgi:hypothetical protein